MAKYETNLGFYTCTRSNHIAISHTVGYLLVSLAVDYTKQYNANLN